MELKYYGHRIAYGANDPYRLQEVRMLGDAVLELASELGHDRIIE